MIVADGESPPEPGSPKGMALFGDTAEEAERLAFYASGSKGQGLRGSSDQWAGQPERPRQREWFRGGPDRRRGGRGLEGELPGSCEPLPSYTLTGSSANIRSMCAVISSAPPLSIRTNSRAVR